MQKSIWVFLSNLAWIICRKVRDPGAFILTSMHKIEKSKIWIQAPPAYQYEPLSPNFEFLTLKKKKKLSGLP